MPRAAAASQGLLRIRPREGPASFWAKDIAIASGLHSRVSTPVASGSWVSLNVPAVVPRSG